MLIVDAYNLLNVQGILPNHLAGLDLVELVGLIQSGRHASDRVVLVCDGHLSHLAERVAGRSENHVRVMLGSVELLFSAPGVEADDVIEALLAHHAGSNTVTMVSSDRRLNRSARKVGARPMSSEAFLRRLAIDHDRTRYTVQADLSRNTPMSRESLTYWMHEFGQGDPVERSPEPPVPTPPLTGGSTEAPDKSQESEPPRPRPLDDLLVRLIRESRLSIDPVDLDMDRWLTEHPPQSE